MRKDPAEERERGIMEAMIPGSGGGAVDTAPPPVRQPKPKREPEAVPEPVGVVVGGKPGPVALLQAGLPLRDVLRSCGVTQAQLAKQVRSRPQRVQKVLTSLAEARKQGLPYATRVFKAAAKALDLPMESLPEYQALQARMRREEEAARVLRGE